MIGVVIINCVPGLYGIDSKDPDNEYIIDYYNKKL